MVSALHGTCEGAGWLPGRYLILRAIAAREGNNILCMCDTRRECGRSSFSRSSSLWRILHSSSNMQQATCNTIANGKKTATTIFSTLDFWHDLYKTYNSRFGVFCKLVYFLFVAVGCFVYLLNYFIVWCWKLLLLQLLVLIFVCCCHRFDFSGDISNIYFIYFFFRKMMHIFLFIQDSIDYFWKGEKGELGVLELGT